MGVRGDAWLDRSRAAATSLVGGSQIWKYSNHQPGRVWSEEREKQPSWEEMLESIHWPKEHSTEPDGQIASSRRSIRSDRSAGLSIDSSFIPRGKQYTARAISSRPSIEVIAPTPQKRWWGVVAGSFVRSLVRSGPVAAISAGLRLALYHDDDFFR